MIYLSGFFTFYENLPSSELTDTSHQSKPRKQCNCLRITEILPHTKHEISSVAFTWSYCLLITNEGEALLVGYSGGKSHQILKLTPPDKGFIVQGACSSKKVHLLTREGIYWLYDRKTHEWKNVTRILNAEKVENEFGEGNKNCFIIKVDSSDQINLAVDKSGIIFSVPSRLDVAGAQVIDVACGKEHSLLLTNTHSVYSWGTGSRGQLGHGSIEGEDQPREIAALCGLKVISIAAGGWHSCCITDEHDLYSWGWNCNGQLGFPGENQETADGKLKVVSVLAEPRVVDWPADSPENVCQVACGSRHTIALLDDYSVWGCGWNSYNQLSENLPESVFCMSKLTLPTNLKIEKVICGDWNSAFVAEESTISRSTK